MQGRIQLVFLTPENLIDNKIYRKMLLSSIYQEKLVAVCIDEAHCIQTWGDQFRITFSQIGDIRSLIPKQVKIIALTATASKDTLCSVIKRLSLKDPVIVAVSPYRENISYEIRANINMDEFTSEISEEIKTLQSNFPKTVVFVRSYKDCSCIYSMVKRKSGIYFTEPPDFPDMSEFRLVDMYTRVLTNDKKSQVMESFSSPGGKL